MPRSRKKPEPAPPRLPEPTGEELDALAETWREAWPRALDAWSRFTKLSEPRWCRTVEDETREELSGSFAMIRLVDHAVVISLRQVQQLHLGGFSVEVLAHEIGHHVYTPADLTDNARLLARIRRGLPSREAHGPLIANLYEDLLINDRLQRMAGLDMAGVYRALGKSPGRLWQLYMRIYELLWRLDRGTLADGVDVKTNFDAQLGARLIRSYAKEWLDGAGRFAALCLPYLMEDTAANGSPALGWCDALTAGKGGLPEGLSEMDAGEEAGALHPALDPDFTGVPADPNEPAMDAANPTGRETGRGGVKSNRTYRDPVSYADVLLAAGAKLSREDLIARYYRERAVPYLIPFPTRPHERASDPIPEGLDAWDVGSPLEQIDWIGTLTASPVVIPGMTTRERVYGGMPGASPERLPVDLYLGVDCSGSMTNPAYGVSYPVIAGAVMCLSALRAGSHVMVALSGEPGRTVRTDGFLRDERTVLKTLTSYLGTGYSFGIHRLAETFGQRPRDARPAHILVVSDQDIFSILDAVVDGKSGWDVARESARAAGGGATYALQVHPRSYPLQIERMRHDGWHVSTMQDQQDLVEFAREFSRRTWGSTGR